MNKLVRISEFKAKCIGLIRETRRTGNGIVITLRGKPVARVEPIEEDGGDKRLGALADATRVTGDILTADFSDDWEISR